MDTLLTCSSIIRDVSQNKLHDTTVVCKPGATITSIRKKVGKLPPSGHERITLYHRSYESATLQSLYKLYNIDKSRTTSYHPEGNSQAERYNCTLHGRLTTIAPSKKKRWPEVLPEMVQAYDATPHASTGCSPHHLLFGQDAKLPLDAMLAAAGSPAPRQSPTEATGGRAQSAPRPGRRRPRHPTRHTRARSTTRVARTSQDTGPLASDYSRSIHAPLQAPSRARGAARRRGRATGGSIDAT